MMQVCETMAFGGCDDTILSKNMDEGDVIDEDNTIAVKDAPNNQQSADLPEKNVIEGSSSEIDSNDSLLSNFSERNKGDRENYASERNFDDFINSSDSLSSSASMSDSDLTSTDSEDSLALSESESITDVTPLNSPYCDSPLPQGRHMEHKLEDKNLGNSPRHVEYDGHGDDCRRPEMNVLLKAIEKLELEAKKSSEQQGVRGGILRKRASSCSSEEAKRIEQENQRLFKRVISQQSRIRSLYTASSQPTLKTLSISKHQELVRSDGDISVMPKVTEASKSPKEGCKGSTHRQQKCLSHPSYSCGHLTNKTLSDGLCKSDEKYNHMYPPETEETSVAKVEKTAEMPSVN